MPSRARREREARNRDFIVWFVGGTIARMARDAGLEGDDAISAYLSEVAASEFAKAFGMEPSPSPPPGDER